MDDPIARKFKGHIARNYKYLIQEPLHDHRDEMASKYENRIDYVDISAYAIGKVKDEQSKMEKEKHDSQEESDMSDLDGDSKQNKVFQKINNL